MRDKTYPFILTQHLADESTVGDWHGQERRAADNLNRLYRALYEAVEDDHRGADYFHEACAAACDLWGSEDGLLTLTTRQIQETVARWFPR